MNIWIRLFRFALTFYPRPFRERFGEEIQEVFETGLQDARARGALPGFVLGEAAHLPGSLVDVYLWSIQHGKARAPVLSGGGAGTTGGLTGPKESWAAAIMAGLPNLIYAILIASTAVMARIPWLDQDLIGPVQITFLIVLLLGTAYYGARNGWKGWSDSWLVMLFIVGLGLFSNLVMNMLPGSADDSWLSWLQTSFIPLSLAYLLYRIARADRRRGLMAALPLTIIPWGVFQEFVPELPRTLAWLWLSLLGFGCAVLMLRARRFSTALGLALVAPVLGGLPFAYLGVYMGGTLPFSEPGPSWAEVFRQYIPYLTAMLSITIAPQLAIKLRQLGLRSTQPGGALAYRLVLGGVLLGLTISLISAASLLGGEPYQIQAWLPSIWTFGLITAAAVYALGFGLLIKFALASPDLSNSYRTGLLLAALFILLPALPAILYLAVSQSMANEIAYAWLLRALELACLAAGFWLAKEKD